MRESIGGSLIRARERCARVTDNHRLSPFPAWLNTLASEQVDGTLRVLLPWRSGIAKSAVFPSARARRLPTNGESAKEVSISLVNMRNANFCLAVKRSPHWSMPYFCTLNARPAPRTTTGGCRLIWHWTQAFLSSALPLV